MNAELALLEALRASRDRALRPPADYAWTPPAGWREPSLSVLDEASRVRLVWADLLMQRGDPRGEQLVLEHLVEHRPEWPTWRAEAERLLDLVTERGFVCIPEDPDASLLDWSGVANNPFQFRAEHAGKVWEVRYQRGTLSLTRGRAKVFAGPLGLDRSDDWTDADINLYLHLVSDVVRSGEPLVVPSAAERQRDPRHRPGRYPRYRVPGGGTVYARDISRWNAVYRRVK